VGLAFGVLARQGGLEPWQAGALSLVVFAGSSQFVAVAMLGAGASVASIAAATFVVNFRHALMSSALSVHLAGAGRGFLSLFAHGVTDESFALNVARFRDGGWDRRRALAVHLATWAAWALTTVAGAWVGRLIPPGALGIDYALTAMFLCLLVLQLRGRIHVVAACLSGGLAVLLSLVLRGHAHVVPASLLGAFAGLGLLRRARRQEAAR
jgi:4-azaleucine resistance transporter AzlC